MKRYYLSLLTTILFAGANLFAEPVTMTVGIYDHSGTMPSVPKAPPHVPYVDLNGHSITFADGHEDYSLSIIDEYDNIVYSVIVPSALTTLMLPSTLSGSYQLRLEPDNSSIYFYGSLML